MAQNRMTHEALLNQLDRADTDLLRRVSSTPCSGSLKPRQPRTSVMVPTSGGRREPHTATAIESGFSTPGRGAWSCRFQPLAERASRVRRPGEGGLDTMTGAARPPTARGRP
jgi:hypothetical protein